MHPTCDILSHSTTFCGNSGGHGSGSEKKRGVDEEEEAEEGDGEEEEGEGEAGSRSDDVCCLKSLSLSRLEMTLP